MDDSMTRPCRAVMDAMLCECRHGRWTVVAWDPLCFLRPFAKRFVEQLVADCVDRSIPAVNSRDAPQSCPSLRCLSGE